MAGSWEPWRANMNSSCCVNAKGIYYPKRNFASDGCVVVTTLGFIIIFSEGLLILFTAKMFSQIEWFTSQKSWLFFFIVLHIVMFWVNSLGVPFEKKYFLPKAVPAICSKSWAKLSSSTGWMICLEMVPAQVWSCFRGLGFSPFDQLQLVLSAP